MVDHSDMLVHFTSTFINNIQCSNSSPNELLNLTRRGVHPYSNVLFLGSGVIPAPDVIAAVPRIIKLTDF